MFYYIIFRSTFTFWTVVITIFAAFFYLYLTTCSTLYKIIILYVAYSGIYKSGIVYFDLLFSYISLKFAAAPACIIIIAVIFHALVSSKDVKTGRQKKVYDVDSYQYLDEVRVISRWNFRTSMIIFFSLLNAFALFIFMERNAIKYNINYFIILLIFIFLDYKIYKLIEKERIGFSGYLINLIQCEYEKIRSG